jgi:putative ABC transport system substrate-binding protein
VRREAKGVSENTGIETMSGKVLVWLLATIVLATALPAEALETVRRPTIGWLDQSSPNPEVLRLIELFRKGLLDAGYIEGKNIGIEYRYAEGKTERLEQLAAELVRLKVDCIVTAGGQPTGAAQRATKMIPIVMAVSGDPVASGFVASLARPGGNITGLTIISPQLSGKRLELLKEIVPGLSRVGVLRAPKAHGPAWKEVEPVARSLGLQLRPLDAESPDDLVKAFAVAKKNRVEALLTLPHALFNRDYRTMIVELTAKSRLPAMYGGTEFLEVGGLMGYGPDISDNFRRAATYVDKILKGIKPADLPVEQPTKFEFLINLKTAKQIGLTIPPNVLARADRVIR